MLGRAALVMLLLSSVSSSQLVWNHTFEKHSIFSPAEVNLTRNGEIIIDFSLIYDEISDYTEVLLKSKNSKCSFDILLDKVKGVYQSDLLNEPIRQNLSCWTNDYVIQLRAKCRKNVRLHLENLCDQNYKIHYLHMNQFFIDPSQLSLPPCMCTTTHIPMAINLTDGLIITSRDRSMRTLDWRLDIKIIILIGLGGLLSISLLLVAVCWQYKAFEEAQRIKRAPDFGAKLLAFYQMVYLREPEPGDYYEYNENDEDDPEIIIELPHAASPNGSVYESLTDASFIATESFEDGQSSQSSFQGENESSTDNDGPTSIYSNNDDSSPTESAYESDDQPGPTNSSFQSTTNESNMDSDAPSVGEVTGIHEICEGEQKQNIAQPEE